MSSNRKYLFIPLTSFGYLFPAIKIAHILQERGEDVLFATTIRYVDLLNLNGIPSVGILNQASGEPFLFPGTWYCDPYLSNTVDTFSKIIESYRPDVIVSNPLGLSAMLVAEKYEIPFINIGFCEYLYPGIGEENPTKEWRIKEFTGFYNQNRAKLSLPPIPVSPENSPLIGDKYLIRNIPSLDEPRELPPMVSHVGALYWEPAYKNPRLNRFIRDSKGQQRPIVYLQIGRLFGDTLFWDQLLNVIKELPYHFVADFGRADYLQNMQEFPNNLFGSPFIPLGHISSDVDFVICSAQSTSVVSAITHGKPILSIPHSADGHEFTQKIESKKIGLGIMDKSNVHRDYMMYCFEQMQSLEILQHVAYYQQQFQAYEQEERLIEALNIGYQYV